MAAARLAGSFSCIAVARKLAVIMHRMMVIGECFRFSNSKVAAVMTALPSAAFGLLASNLKAVWSAPATDVRLKKRIVRTLIHEVVADIDDAATEIVLVIHWNGGVHSEVRFTGACRAALLRASLFSGWNPAGSRSASRLTATQHSGKWCCPASAETGWCSDIRAGLWRPRLLKKVAGQAPVEPRSVIPDS
jgi:hypothetical protein